MQELINQFLIDHKSGNSVKFQVKWKVDDSQWSPELEFVEVSHIEGKIQSITYKAKSSIQTSFIVEIKAIKRCD